MNDPHHVVIHEAGHAVIGRVLAMPCGGATVVPCDALDAEGHATIASAYTTLSEWEKRERFRPLASAYRARALTAMAGHEAEIEVFGEAYGCDEDDREVAFAEVRDLAPVQDDEASEAATEARLRRMARMLVRRHRADIERVAAALLERRTLTGEEIDAMLPPGFMARPVTWVLAI